MTETYKYKSKIATAISFIAAFIVYIGQDGLAQLIPVEYAKIIPVIIFIAGYILTQSTEDKRVEVAEQMVKENYAAHDPTTPGHLNEEYDIVGDEENGC